MSTPWPRTAIGVREFGGDRALNSSKLAGRPNCGVGAAIAITGIAAAGTAVATACVWQFDESPWSSHLPFPDLGERTEYLLSIRYRARFARTAVNSPETPEAVCAAAVTTTAEYLRPGERHARILHRGNRYRRGAGSSWLGISYYGLAIS